MRGPGRLARDAYTYLHVPMWPGSSPRQSPTNLLIARRPARCAGAGLPMVLGGPALYLLGESLFSLGVAGVTSAERLAIAVFLALLAPIASHVSALALSATVTTLPSALAPWELGTARPSAFGVDRGR